MYLCGTKYDLVEENKKLRKIDTATIRDYGDGKSVYWVCAGVSPLTFSLSKEIQAKYTETSAKNGYNIGKLCYVIKSDMFDQYFPTPEPLFLNVAEEFIQNSKNKISSRPGKG